MMSTRIFTAALRRGNVLAATSRALAAQTSSTTGSATTGTTYIFGSDKDKKDKKDKDKKDDDSTANLSDTWNKAKDATADAAWNKAKDATADLSDTWNKAKDATADAAQRIKSAGKEKLQEFKDESKGQSWGDKAEKAKEKLGEFKDEMESAANESDKKLNQSSSSGRSKKSQQNKNSENKNLRDGQAEKIDNWQMEAVEGDRKWQQGNSGSQSSYGTSSYGNNQDTQESGRVYSDRSHRPTPKRDEAQYGSGRSEERSGGYGGRMSQGQSQQSGQSQRQFNRQNMQGYGQADRGYGQADQGSERYRGYSSDQADQGLQGQRSGWTGSEYLNSDYGNKEYGRGQSGRGQSGRDNRSSLEGSYSQTSRGLDYEPVGERSTPFSRQDFQDDGWGHYGAGEHSSGYGDVQYTGDQSYGHIRNVPNRQARDFGNVRPQSDWQERQYRSQPSHSSYDQRTYWGRSDNQSPSQRSRSADSYGTRSQSYQRDKCDQRGQHDQYGAWGQEDRSSDMERSRRSGSQDTQWQGFNRESDISFGYGASQQFGSPRRSSYDSSRQNESRQSNYGSYGQSNQPSRQNYGSSSAMDRADMAGYGGSATYGMPAGRAYISQGPDLNKDITGDREMSNNPSQYRNQQTERFGRSEYGSDGQNYVSSGDRYGGSSYNQARGYGASQSMDRSFGNEFGNADSRSDSRSDAKNYQSSDAKNYQSSDAKNYQSSEDRQRNSDQFDQNRGNWNQQEATSDTRDHNSLTGKVMDKMENVVEKVEGIASSAWEKISGSSAKNDATSFKDRTPQ